MIQIVQISPNAVDGRVDLGHDFHRGERRMTARVGVERGNAHETVNAALGLEHAEGIRTLHLEVHVLVARFFTRLRVVLLDLPTLLLGIPLIHAIQHRDPVASLRAALTRVQLDEDIALVELAAQKRLQTQFVKVAVRLRALAQRVLERDLLRFALFHLGELKHHARILDRLQKRVIGNHVRTLGVRRRNDLTGLRLVVPEIALRLLLLKTRQLRPTLVDLDVLGHLTDAPLQILDALTDLFNLQQLGLHFLCHLLSSQSL